MNRKSFTLMELLVVIAILAVLAALIVGNFFTSLKKGRDAARKTDLQNIQKALEDYYGDKGVYPTSIPFSSAFCETSACNTGEKVYMERLPNDPVTGRSYEYVSPSGTGADYRIYACLEDNQQMLPFTASGYSTSTMTGCGSCFNSSGAAMAHCVFSVSSTNLSP